MRLDGSEVRHYWSDRVRRQKGRGDSFFFFFVLSLPTRIQRRLTVPTHRHVRYCWRAIGLDVITPLLLPHIPSRFLPFYLFFFFFLLLLQMMEIISMPTQPLCTY